MKNYLYAFNTKKAKWYFHRLKIMSVRELGVRSLQTFQFLWEKYFLTNKTSRPLELSPYKAIFCSDKYTSISNASAAYQAFGIKIGLDKKINWHKDPGSDNEFPRLFYHNIDIRNPEYGSARYVYEINRMQYLPILALNFKRTGSKKWLKRIVEIITDWTRQNPFLIGINWQSNLEVNLRLISWFVTWQILEPHEHNRFPIYFNEFVDSVWVPSIYQHCVYSYKHPSLFSSANNHRIGELTGAFVSSCLWQFPESKKWRMYAQNNLESEIKRQHSLNGVNNEEAFGYAIFVADLLALAYTAGEESGNRFSSGFKNLLRKIFDYLFNATDSYSNSPRYGDDDGASASGFELKGPGRIKSLMVSAAILFKDEKYKSKTGNFDRRNEFLFGKKGRRIFDSLIEKKAKNSSVYYPKEGHCAA